MQYSYLTLQVVQTELKLKFYDLNIYVTINYYTQLNQQLETNEKHSYNIIITKYGTYPCVISSIITHYTMLAPDGRVLRTN